MGRSHTHHLSKFAKEIPGLPGERLATISMTIAEQASLIGISHYYEIDVTLADEGMLWYWFKPPADRDIGIALRNMSPNLSGVSYELYEPTEDYTLGDPIPSRPFNPDTETPSTAEVYYLSSPGTVGDKYVTPIFIGSGGVNPTVKGGGSNSRDSGFWVYPRGSDGAFAKITNFSGASNRIIFRLDYIEPVNYA